MVESTESSKSSRKAEAKPGSDPSPEERRRLIAEAAYYRAKERGFEPGHELEDWVQAESEVKSRFKAQAR